MSASGHRHRLADAVAFVAEAEDEEGEAPAVGRGQDVEGRHGGSGDAEGQRVVDTVGAELAEPLRVLEAGGPGVEGPRALGVRVSARPVAGGARLGVEGLGPRQVRALERRRVQTEAGDRALTARATGSLHHVGIGLGLDQALDLAEGGEQGRVAAQALGEGVRVGHELELFRVLAFVERRARP